MVHVHCAMPGGLHVFLSNEFPRVTTGNANLICFIFQTKICAFCCCQLEQQSGEENDDVINKFTAVTEA